MKKSIFTLSALTIAVALTASFTACSNDDILMEEEQTNGKVHSYSVSIPANFGEEGTRAVELGTGDKEGYLVSTFKTTDIISVYNKSNSNEHSSVNLTPATEGKRVDLTGNLTFTTAPNVGDVLLLCYNPNNDTFDYSSQNGTLAGLSDFDFATAEVTITSINGGVIMTSPANFVNAQSMFKFTFTGLPDGVNVKEVYIYSTKNNLFENYRYTSKFNSPVSDLRISNSSNTTNVYAALRFKPLSAGVTEDITFSVKGTDKKYYYGVKPSPAGGFQNSKYYTSTIALQPLAAPTVERYDNGPTSELSTIDNYFRFYAHYNTFTSHDISISGNSCGYMFSMWDPIEDKNVVGHSTVTLKGNGTATCLIPNCFFTCWMNITFVLDGDYTINCPYNSAAITSQNNTLKLKGNGTLTVIVNSATTAGLSCHDYNSTTDASVLAEDGYTVTRSARVDGPDEDHDNEPDYYTWTYTVRPA